MPHLMACLQVFYCPSGQDIGKVSIPTLCGFCRVGVGGEMSAVADWFWFFTCCFYSFYYLNVMLLSGMDFNLLHLLTVICGSGIGGGLASLLQEAHFNQCP